MQDILLGLKSGPATTPCTKCRKSFDVTDMIEAYRPDRIDPDMVCRGCWAKRELKPAVAPTFVPPKSVDPRASFSASSHDTFESAMKRKAIIAAHLGVIAEIWPNDMNAAGPFSVCPDSKLVPGFKPAPNPYA